MRKVAVDKKGDSNFFTSSMIKDCMKKVITVTLHETVQVSLFDELYNIFKLYVNDEFIVNLFSITNRLILKLNLKTIHSELTLS